ncbi:MAG TPA: heavy metal-binding domain-containing protein [Mycobacteriales bacterium]|nr:heavy metal-binding domain-containing protein [Mycobacteriales bacterium]
MTDWDATGLPPAAQTRISRAASSALRSSLLSVEGDAALGIVGLTPVGEVMGCIVSQLGWGGWGGCGYSYTRSGSGYIPSGAPPVTSSDSSWAGFAPYVKALYKGYETALHRMLAEAQALGADGVVGVTVTREQLGVAQMWEYVARGTAVVARGKQRPTHLFSTDLSGGDVAKLMHAGWVPVSMMWGISVAVRHDDYATRVAARSWSQQNVEVPGYSELVTYARADARWQFENRVAKYGADSAIVTDMSMRIWEIEPSDGHRDHVAESVIVGNGLAQFHRSKTATTDSLLVMPLRKGSS